MHREGVLNIKHHSLSFAIMYYQRAPFMMYEKRPDVIYHKRRPDIMRDKGHLYVIPMIGMINGVRM